MCVRSAGTYLKKSEPHPDTKPVKIVKLAFSRSNWFRAALDRLYLQFGRDGLIPLENLTIEVLEIANLQLADDDRLEIVNHLPYLGSKPGMLDHCYEIRIVVLKLVSKCSRR